MARYGRKEKTADSILSNAALTEELDDPAARPLLHWGVAWAERIAESTDHIEDDNAAEEAMYPQMKALRKMMRNTSRWLSMMHEMDAESNQDWLAKVLKEAGNAYGEDFAAPDPAAVEQFLKRCTQQSQAMNVQQLRKIIDPNAP